MDDLDLLLADLDRPKSTTQVKPVTASNSSSANTKTSYESNDINNEIQSIIDELDSQPTPGVSVKQPTVVNVNNVSFSVSQSQPQNNNSNNNNNSNSNGSYYQNENLQDAGDDLDSLMASLNTSITTALKAVPTPEESQKLEEQQVQQQKPQYTSTTKVNSANGGVVTSSASLAKKPSTTPSQPSYKQAPVPQQQPQQSSSASLSTDDLDELLKNLSPQQPSVVTVPPPVNSNVPKATPVNHNHNINNNFNAQPVKPVNHTPSTATTNFNVKTTTSNNQFSNTPLAQPPKPTANKVLAGDDLDNLLNNLTIQIDDIDSSGPTSRGTCGGCRKPIYGESIQAMGKFYHPEHFACQNCQNPLGTRNFYEQDGLPHCEKCYQELFCARCAHCDDPISDRCITALGKKWHVHHFVCTQCLKPFEGGNFFERDGRPYCEADFYSTFASRCGGCNQPIRGECINALGTQWHPEHFVCQYCQKSFSGGTFFEYGGKPYCDIHYHQQAGSVCAGCGKAVSGRCVDALDKKWHPEHFVCAFCMNPLAGGAYTANNGKPYCKVCHSKLF